MKPRLILLGGCGVLAGCVVGPEPVAPALSVSETFEAAPQPERIVDPEIAPLFDDPVLIELVRVARAGNLDIAFALANLDVARANVRAADSDLLPTLDAFVDSQLSGILTGGADADLSLTSGAAFTYDPDIAGRNARARQAAIARFEAAALNVADVERLITEAVALDYIALRRAEARLELLNESLELQQRTIEIVQARFEVGLSPALDVDRARADLARTRGQRGLFEADRKDAAYRLSILGGTAPRSDWLGMAGDPRIPEASGLPDTGLPADLLRNRPDVRRAEAEVVSALALVGVETADLYPSLRLPGSLSARTTTATAPGDAVTFSLSALLDVPLFDFGRRQAEVDAQSARAEAAIADYQASLFEAQREVESALVRLEALRLQRADLQEAVKSSEAAFDQLDALYREGLAGFIDVLDAQRTLIQIREQIVETDAAYAETVARLATALGVPLAG